MKNGNIILQCIILLIIILLSGCNTNSQSMEQLELNKGWKFRQVGQSEWLAATVPGTVHTDLLDNGKIEDPFYRLNEHDLQWIDKADWEYETEFILTNEILSKDKVEVHFYGLDTYAKVYLNDSLILVSENMFQQHTVDCKEFLRIGNNKMLVQFESPIIRGIEKYDSLDYQIPVSDNDLAEIGKVEGNKQVSIFTRKAGYHFGWDWGPRLVTSGIWRPIVLQAWNSHKITDLFIQQTKLSDIAELVANVEVNAFEASKEINLEVLVNGNLVKNKTINLAEGQNYFQIPFEIKNPELWWPNGLGNQTLYTVDVVLSRNTEKDIKSKRIGLRTVELVKEPDTYGTSFYFKVNGHPVFMKGANYIPQDIFLSRVSEDRYKHILQSAKDANMNMLRVWGGGVYESDLFYDLCDEMGLLVWQDFMFACAMFPGDSNFLASVKLEAIDNVKRLRNHTSIALWCGNNEILSAWENWGWKNRVAQEQSPKTADIIWKAYDDIFHKILPDVVKNYDTETPYWPSSPGSAFGEKERQDKGDMHYWGVWWGKEPFTNYETVMPRFMSEFGFQSFPELSTVEKYALPEDYDIYSEVMKSHQRSSIGNGTIDEYMLRHYKKPKDFESFLYVSHLLQAQGIGFGIEAQRRNRQRCMGSLYWQIDDCWPVASWSSIDYYGKWKALHYEAKKAFETYLISFREEKDKIQVFIVSDSLENVTARLQVQLLNFDGDVLKLVEKEVDVIGNKSQVYLELSEEEWLGKAYKANNVVLKANLIANEKQFAEKLYYLLPPKKMSLPNAVLNFEVKENKEQYVVNISSDKLAKGVYITSNLSGNFSNNYFDVIPGENYKVYINKEENINIESFRSSIKLMSLVDSY